MQQSLIPLTLFYNGNPMAMTGSLVSNLEDEFEDQDDEMENLEDEAMEGDSDMVSFFSTFHFVHDLQPVVGPDITTVAGPDITTVVGPDITTVG